MRVRRREDWIGKLAILVVPPESYAYISSEMPVELVNEWGMEGIFVSANKPYLTVENSFKQSGILDKITFVDCASRLAGEEPTGEKLILINNPADLPDLTKSITRITRDCLEKRFLVFDSLTTLLIYSEFGSLTQFAHTLGLIMKARKVTCLFLAVDQEATKEMLTFLSSIADKYVHLKVSEDGQVMAIGELPEPTTLHETMPFVESPPKRVVPESEIVCVKQYSVFLCYKISSGKDFADHLKAGLEEFGLHTFQASKDIPEVVDKGTEWSQARDKALNESMFFILIMTPGFELSSEVIKELSVARTLQNKRFVFFRFRNMGRKIILHLENEELDLGKQEQVSFETKEEILRLAINILTKGKA